MAKFNNTVFNASMGEMVLSVLSRHQTLPSWGVLAGQSVSSAIDEIRGTGNPVYNDIDWFVDELAWERESGEYFKCYQRIDTNAILVSGGVTFTEPLEPTFDSYEATLKLAERNLYSVVHAEMQGMLNKVAVSWCPGVESAQRTANLVKAFDINNTQVGVDLRTGELVASNKYLEFFRTRQLKITNGFTPVQSLFRLLKKADELSDSVYVNKAQAIDFVKNVVAVNEGSTHSKALRISRFTEGGMAFESRELFDASKKDESPRYDTFHPLGKGFYGTPLCFGEKYRPKMEESFNLLKSDFNFNKREKGGLWLCTTRNSAPSSSFFIKGLKAGCSATRVPTRHEENYFPKSGITATRRELFQSIIGEMAEVSADTYLQGYAHAGDDWLVGIESHKTRAKLKKATSHEEFVRKFGAAPVLTQLAAYDAFRAQFKRLGLEDAWGILDGYSSAALTRVISDTAAMESLINDSLGSTEQLVKQLPLPSEVRGVSLVELLSQRDLNAEGTKMKHCVAGYAYHLSAFKSRLVSFRKGAQATSRATAEWTIFEDKSLPSVESFVDVDNKACAMWPLQLQLAQLKSFANQVAPDAISEVCGEVMAQLNAWLIEHPHLGWELLRPGRYLQVKEHRSSSNDGASDDIAIRPVLRRRGY